MKYFYKISILLCALFLLTTSIYAQSKLDDNKKYMTFGVVGGANFIQHQTTIPLIPGSIDCGNYENGESLGYYLGITGSYSIINNFLSIEAGLIYDYRPAELQTTTNNFEIYDPINEEYQFLELRHTYTSSLTYLDFILGFKLIPYSPIPFYFKTLFDAGNPIFNSGFTNKQRIISPESALFPSGVKERTIAEGDLNSAGTSLGASLTIGYEIELQKDFYFAPEISYRYGINSVSSDYDWKTNIIRVGLTAFWAIPISSDKKKIEDIKISEEVTEIIEKPIETKEPVEKVVVKTPPVIQKDMIEKLEVSSLKLTETVVTQTYPLLLYLFFDSTSVDLDSKYIKQTSKQTFNEDALPTNTLDIYYYVLDIIGLRMAKHPNSKITLTGTSDGTELPNEEQRRELSKLRAESVADYLRSKWAINSERITIVTRDKPELATSEIYSEGYEENRRVEISSTSPELLAPVIHSKFLEFSSNQSNIFVENSINDSNIISWEFNLVDNLENQIFKTTGKGLPDKIINVPVNSILINDAGKTISENRNITAVLKITDVNGKVERKESSLDIVKSENQFEVGRLNLIVFEFDRYDITNLNKELIKEFIQSAIQKNSIVDIIGGTDILGAEDYNYQLSRDRANSVESFLKSINPKIHIRKVEGEGSNRLKYDNKLPEGRFYCRTVMIEVKTPINK